MASRPLLIVILIAAVSFLSACASNGAPVDDPAVGKSGRKHYGEGHEIKLFSRPKPPIESSAVPSVGDPQYQEYLEWKRWQEFKAYQEWKAQNPDASPPASQ